MRQIETGTELVNKSGESLQEIVQSVKRLTEIVGEIASASREQSTGIDQVNHAIASMDQITQSNAAQTEELAATAQALSGQSDDLVALVARFQLGAGGAPPAAAAAKASVPAARASRVIPGNFTPASGSTREVHPAAVKVAGAGEAEFDEF